MKVELTKEQIKEFEEDQFLYINAGRTSVYIELNRDGEFWYEEVAKINEKGQRRKAYCFDANDLGRLIPKRTDDPSYWHNDPLCPNCGTYMIYHFEHCPKCGQKLDWSEKGELK